jgi:hypothetical protein
MLIRHAAQNASGDSQNENALTELAAEGSLRPDFQLRGAWRWRSRRHRGMPVGDDSRSDNSRTIHGFQTNVVHQSVQRHQINTW